jgi:hypothetical protein
MMAKEMRMGGLEREGTQWGGPQREGSRWVVFDGVILLGMPAAHALISSHPHDRDLM